MSALKKLVERIIKTVDVGDITVHGLGMARIHITPKIRIHLWHPEFQEPGVTELHTHPWDLRSTIIAGSFTEEVWQQATYGYPFQEYIVGCGVGGGGVRKGCVSLLQRTEVTYRGAGDRYHREASTIHRVLLSKTGAITLMYKGEKDTGVASVFSKCETPFGDARQRPAEVKDARTLIKVMKLLEEVDT